MLSRGGCQPGLVMAKCMSDNSVFPSSACWYTEASVCPADSHCTRKSRVSRTVLCQEPSCTFPVSGEALPLEDGNHSALSIFPRGPGAPQPQVGPHAEPATCVVPFLRELGQGCKLGLKSSPGSQAVCPWYRIAFV